MGTSPDSLRRVFSFPKEGTGVTSWEEGIALFDKSYVRLLVTSVTMLIALLAGMGVSSADSIFTLKDLVAPKTVSITELGFDHDLANPLVITITGATWAPGSVGDVTLRESSLTGILSDLIRFTNVSGVATIYFGSSDFNDVLPLTGPLSGPSPGFLQNYIETDAGTKVRLYATYGAAGPGAATVGLVDVNLVSDPSPTISDQITLQAVPEPSTFTLLGLGVGLMVFSGRHRRK